MSNWNNPPAGNPDPAVPGPASKSLRDYLASVVRTVVPIGVGIVLTWLGVKVGIPIPEDVRWVIVGLVMAAYHALIRALEVRYRWIGWLLGLATSPIYVTEPKAAGGVRSQAVDVVVDPPLTDPDPGPGVHRTYDVHVHGDGVEGWLRLARRHIVREPAHIRVLGIR